MRRVLFHRTTIENAELIIRDMFCTCRVQDHHRGGHSSPGAWLSDRQLPHSSPGVWLSDRPLLPYKRYIPEERHTLDGQHGTAQLEVTIDATGAFMNEHESKEDPLFREWLIEATELNDRIISIRKLTMHEAAEACGARVYKSLEFQDLVSDESFFATLRWSRWEILKGLVKIVELVKSKQQLIKLKTEAQELVKIPAPRRKMALAQIEAEWENNAARATVITSATRPSEPQEKS